MLKDTSAEQRADQIVEDHLQVICRRTDHFFAGLLILQWFAAIAAAFLISPYTWAGSLSETHIHVWTAVLLGGLIVSLPVFLVWARPGTLLTRQVVAIAQMLFSALLIHLTGGRIETHFHVFGSLALLAAYRDWRVLLTATLVVALDHAVRGAIWPESVYGVLYASPWRTLEHAGWVIFENIFLILTIRRSNLETRNIGIQQSLLETANRRTEQSVQQRTAELQRAEERLQLIIDSVPNGIVLIDQSGEIKLVNPRAEGMFGFSSQELLGRPIHFLIPGIEIVKPADAPSSAHLPGKSLDRFGVRQDGSEFPVEVSLNSLQSDEGIFVVASIVDITQRKQTEEGLKQYASRLETTNDRLTRAQAELQLKNKELDEFTYVASHDLQEPVRKLVSFSKLLEQDLGGDLSEQASRDLKFIVDAAARMRHLIQDLLALSRTGRSAMKSERVEIGECVSAAVDALQMCIDETQATIEQSEMPSVVGDKMMLTQLYQNLIGNALKFVSKETPRITLTAEDGGNHWILSVRDNGIGMKPEHAERIFKPFQRLHGRDQYEGTGIGLAICKKTVERHGGRLWVESSLNAGAHFKFTLPKFVENHPCPSSGDENHQKLQSC